jgi:hypothetical protein
MLIYNVQSIKDLTNVIIPHFTKYPLQSQKQADFILFKEILELLNAKSHSTAEGLQKIINLRASMNKGLSEVLVKSFPYTTPVPRAIIGENLSSIPHPNWLVGFVDAEGCFYVNIKKSNNPASKPQVLLAFSISQHSRDEVLLSKIIKYLGCGSLEKPVTRLSTIAFVVYKFSDISDKIIPFFHKYPLLGVKFLDYSNFSQVALLMKNKAHLTAEGLEQIRLIKLGMNKGRINI